MSTENSKTEQPCTLQSVTPRLSSYQKLKKENEQLRDEIYTLVRESETTKGIMLKMQYNIHFDTIDAIMMGSRTSDKTTFGGILSMVTQNEG